MVEHLIRTFQVPPGIFYITFWGSLIAGSLLLGLALNRIIHYWRKKLSNEWGQFVFSFLESLPIPLLLITSLYAGMESLPLSPYYEHLWSKVILALVLLVLAYLPAKFVVLGLQRLGQRNPAMERVTQPATFIVRMLFAVLAAIIFLENLGISLTAVWTTLGVGSVAVALALQETLTNLFSGLYLLADRPVNPGDYIKLDSNQEGYVLRIGWRSTTLRTLQNNYVLVPNSTLAKAVITNYSVPETRMAYSLPVSVTYGTDPERVEKALLEVTREALTDGVEGLLAQPAPSVSLISGFGESSLNFTLSVQVRQFTDQYSVQSELRKRIVKKFQEAGITMPFPTRTLLLDKSQKDLLSGGSEN